MGRSVAIIGSGLTGASAVEFNDVSAESFTVDSDTQITVVVPAGASTGPVTVTTPGGTGTSSTDFVVRHAREISLTLGSSKASGDVSVTDGFAACASGVPVRAQYRESGTWRTVASVLTNASGAYSAGGVSTSGRYRAIAGGTTLSSGDRCIKDISPTATT